MRIDFFGHSALPAGTVRYARRKMIHLARYSREPIRAPRLVFTVSGNASVAQPFDVRAQVSLDGRPLRAQARAATPGKPSTSSTAACGGGCRGYLRIGRNAAAAPGIATGGSHVEPPSRPRPGTQVPLRLVQRPWPGWPSEGKVEVDTRRRMPKGEQAKRIRSRPARSAIIKMVCLRLGTGGCRRRPPGRSRRPRVRCSDGDDERLVAGVHSRCPGRRTSVRWPRQR